MVILRALLLLLILLVAWDVAWWMGGVGPASPRTLKLEINEGRAPVILDVRTRAEFEAFHIPGAINLPMPPDQADLERAVPDKAMPVVVICMTGHRSPPIAKLLQREGYTNVRNLTWGMTAWKLFGGETVSGH
ncbi:rhodanese-like domain-containing protein [Pseudodesulfovibrio tunisiensis]|uniref:rhodanese-like domain-containing protein n=1 Tax=Pseudodesulfovibrio tunisiensis TaxID=463192 RepID=UPI001FB1DC51|nr:rhodanese-like domain-containing protein [Pseudodesulfovibrio tunisiensis]